MEDRDLVLDYAKIWIDADGICRVIVLPGVEITLEVIQVMLAAQAVVSRGEKTPVLVDVREIKFMTRAAREHIAGEEGQKRHPAAALLIDSPIGRALGNFFLRVNKPHYPTRLFTSEDEAITWLKSYLE